MVVVIKFVSKVHYDNNNDSDNININLGYNNNLIKRWEELLEHNLS